MFRWEKFKKKYFSPKKYQTEKGRMAQFKAMDVDEDGFIRKSEIRAFMKSRHESMGESELSDMLKAFDANEDGKITFEEFNAGVSQVLQ